MISVTILTKNGARRLKHVLEAVESFDDVVILDAGSTDETEAIARLFPNIRWFTHVFEGFGTAHNRASHVAKHPWILSIDADEVPSAALVAEIQALKLDPRNVYSIPFHNFFRGRWIKWCGWYPESHIRLYNRETTAFSNDAVHERILAEGLAVHVLKAPIVHYSYENLSDFLIKMERYSSLFALQYRGKRRATAWTALLHSCAAFFKSYVLKWGFLGGFEGFVISSYNAHTAFYKYLKLYEINHAIGTHVSSCGDRKACKFKRDAR